MLNKKMQVFSVKKCLIDSLSVLFEVNYDALNAYAKKRKGSNSFLSECQKCNAPNTTLWEKDTFLGGAYAPRGRSRTE